MVEKHKRIWKILQVGITIVAVFVFLLHVSTLVAQLMMRPTAFSFTLVDDIPPRMSAITVCPTAPFSPQAMLQLSMNNTCDTLEDCINKIMRVEGLSKDLSLQELWDESILPLPWIVESSSIHGTESIYEAEASSWPNWKVSRTALGPCWTLTPPAQTKGDNIKPLSLRIKHQTPCSTRLHKTPYIENPRDPFLVCEEVGRLCNTSCIEEKFTYSMYENFNKIFVFFHSPEEPPNVLDARNTIMISESIRSDFNFKAWMSVREVEMLKTSNCVSDPNYSLSECLSRCQERLIGNASDCTPFLDKAATPNKACIRQNFEFRQFLIQSFKTGDLNEKLAKCTSDCKHSCKQLHYKFIMDPFEHYPYSNEGADRNYLLTVQVSAPYTEYVVEEEIYSTAKFLTDLGGSLGLCFGAGLLTLYQTIYELLVTLSSQCFRYVFSKQKSTGSPHDGQSSSKTMWLICGSCVCLIAFMTHSLQLIVSYLAYPTVFTVSLLGTQPPFPGVTLCPDVPFDLEKLSQFGMSARNETILGKTCLQGGECERRVLVNLIFNKLPGLWDSNLTVDDVWNTSRSFEHVADKIEYDNVEDDGTVNFAMTTLGVCFTFTPKQSSKIPVSLGIFLTDEFTYRLQERSMLDKLQYHNLGSNYNVTFITHSQNSPPVYLGDNAINFNYEYIKTQALEVQPITVKRISTPRTSCRGERTYSQSKCKYSCLLAGEAEKSGCRLPYLQDSKLPVCDYGDQYMQSFKGNNYKAQPGKGEKCREGCEVECKKIHYSLRPQNMLDKYAGVIPAISIRQPVASNIELSEHLKSSPLSFLSEIGGIMGLYLGVSFLDLSSWVIGGIRWFSRWLCSLKIGMPTQYARLARMGWSLVLYFLLSLYSLMRLQDFLINPKVYTTYSDQTNTWKDFPGVTLCRWPPFNITSLVFLGMNFNVSDYCGVRPWSTSYSCKADLYKFMNELPGLEDVPIAQIWEQASWNLTDMMHSYILNGEEYIVELSDHPHWVPFVTSLNRCFRFVPPDDEVEVSDLHLHLSSEGYRHHFTFPALPSVVEVIEDAMSDAVGATRPHNLIRIHASQDEHVMNDESFDLIVYLNSLKRNYLVTTSLTEILRLKGVRQKCLDEESYSYFNCVHQCILKEFVNEYNCRLPFLSSPGTVICNQTTYTKFPKYFDKVAHKMHNYSRVKEVCMSGCPIDCNGYSYIMQTYDKAFESSESYPYQHSSVTVSMARPTHDSFEEVPALTWASFIAEVGGVAGILTGMSLLALCILILENLTELRDYFKTRTGSNQHPLSVAWQ